MICTQLLNLFLIGVVARDNEVFLGLQPYWSMYTHKLTWLITRRWIISHFVLERCQCLFIPTLFLHTDLLVLRHVALKLCQLINALTKMIILILTIWRLSNTFMYRSFLNKFVLQRISIMVFLSSFRHSLIPLTNALRHIKLVCFFSPQFCHLATLHSLRLVTLCNSIYSISRRRTSRDLILQVTHRLLCKLVNVYYTLRLMIILIC